MENAKLARPDKFQIMTLFKSDILKILQETKRIIFSEGDLADILEDNRSDWKLPQSASVEDLIYFLINVKVIELIELDFPANMIKRYVFFENEPPIYELACSFHEKAYISHYTAAFYHGLTDNIVKAVYVNQEQSPKKENEWKPTQEAIDNAFSKPMRSTSRKTIYKGQKIHWLTGKNTGQLGVLKEDGIQVTNIERTLIDLAVRPEYGGGVHEILTMYENAKDQVSVNKMYSYLKKLKYTYPYHQSVGFYLEKAGYKESSIRLLERLPIELNFYLDYELTDKSFSERWKLYYPAYLS